MTTLSNFQKILLTHRYILLLSDYERRCFFLSLYFHLSHIIVTVGSLIVPALLSIQYTDTSSASTTQWDSQEFSYQIYWGTWVISLLVTIANGILALLKIDKKYYFLHTTLEQLRSEGWQYLELSGRYSGFYHSPDTPTIPTHENQFVYFCHMIEKIKMKQVEEEYYKLNESQATVPGVTARPPLQPLPLQNETAAQTVIPVAQVDTTRQIQNTVLHPAPLVPDGLIPPTPLNPLLLKLLATLQGEKTSKTEVGGDVPELQQSNTTKHDEKQTHGNKQAEDSKMSVRSEMSEPSITKKLILRSTSEIMPESESHDRVGAEIPTNKME